MKNTFLILVLVLVVGAGAYVVMTKNKTPVPVENAMPVNGASGVQETVVTEQGAVKEFTLDSSEFKYDVKTIAVKKGETVKLTLTNSGSMQHDWIVDELTGAKTKRIKNGETDTITFVADKAGVFEYYCSVGQHRANGMVGKITVE